MGFQQSSREQIVVIDDDESKCVYSPKADWNQTAATTLGIGEPHDQTQQVRNIHGMVELTGELNEQVKNQMKEKNVKKKKKRLSQRSLISELTSDSFMM